MTVPDFILRGSRVETELTPDFLDANSRLDEDEDIEDPGDPGLDLLDEPQGIPAASAPSIRERTEAGGEPFRGTIQQGLRTPLTEEGKTSPLQTAIKEGDISTEGAPASARFTSSLGADEKEAEEGLKIGLSQAFGREVETRTGPDTGRLEFKNPITGQFTLINPPGADLGDFAGLGGEGIVAVQETIGGVAGSFASPVVGTAAGIGTGAFIGELTRLKLGQSRGINQDLDRDELIKKALVRAGISAVAGVAGERLIKLGRVILSGVPGPVAVRGGTIEEAQQALRPLQEQVKELTGKKLPLTSGQTLKDPALGTAERQLTSQPESQALRDRFAAQDRVLVELEDAVKSPFSAPLSNQKTGRTVQQAVGKGPRGAIRRVEDDTLQAREGAESATLIAQRGAVSPFEAAPAVRQAFQDGRDITQSLLSGRYSALERKAGGETVDISFFRQVGQRNQQIIKDDLLPSLRAEDASVIRDASKAGLKTREGLEFGPEGLLTPVTKTENVPATYSTVQRTLQQLREEIRFSKKGVTAPKDVVALQELHNALLISRNFALAKRPDLKTLIDDLEADYAQSKDLIDRTLVGEIINKKVGVGYQLRDERVIQRILNSPSGAREIARVINDPKYATFSTAKQPIKEGLLGAYRERVLDPETGIAKIGAHKTFMRNHSQVLRQFFSPDELAKIQRPGSASLVLRDMLKREKEVVNKLNQSLGMKLQRYDSSEVVDQTFKAQKLDDVNRIKRILGESSEEWRAYQGAANQKLFDDISSWDASAQAHRIDPVKLIKTLNNRTGAPLIRAVFGQKHVDNLRILRNALVVAQRNPGRTEDDVLLAIGKGSRRAPALQHLARAYVGMFTVRGRVMTAAQRIKGKAGERAIIEILADPDKLARVIAIRNMSPFSSKAAVVFGGLGATLLSIPDSQE